MAKKAAKVDRSKLTQSPHYDYVPIIDRPPFRLPNGARVAVINAEVTRTFWPKEDPIGKRFRIGRAESPLIEIVGLVTDGQYETLGERPQRRVFLPFVDETDGTLIVHTSASAATTLTAIRQIVNTLDPQVPVARAERE